MSRKIVISYLLASIILTLIAYSNTFRHQYNLDDTFVLRQLPDSVDKFTDCFAVFDEIYDEADYRPLAAFTIALERWITGKENVKLSHKVNALLLLLGAWLLFLSIRLLPVKRASEAAFIAGLIFIAHPIHSNVVSSIKNRDILLSFIFGMTALIIVLASIRFTMKNKVVNIAGKIFLFLLAVGIFLIGTLAKQDIISFAFIIPLAYFIWLKSPKRIFLLLRYALLFGLPYLMYRMFYRFRFEYIGKDVMDIQPVEGTVFMTENPLIMDSSLIGKLGAGLTSVFYYLKFHLVPKGYYFYFGYDMVPTGNLFHPNNIISVIVLVLAAILFFYFLKRRPLLSYGIGFFFLAQLYALNIYMPVAGIVAPRLGYIASAGFCMLLAAIVIELSLYFSRRLGKGQWLQRKVMVIMTAVILLIYTPFTIHRNKAWKNIFTLIEADIDHLDRSFEAQRIAAGTFYNKVMDAPTDLKRDQVLMRSYKHAKLGSKVYSEDQFVEETIGLTGFYLGFYEESFKQMNSVVVRFDSSEAAVQTLGDLYSMRNQYERAAECYAVLGRLHPEQPSPFINYTQSMLAAGKLDQALTFNKSQIKKDPVRYYHYESVGFLYLNLGDTVTATHYFVYALDRGSQNKDIVPVMKDFYQRNGLQEDWERLMEGLRPPLD